MGNEVNTDEGSRFIRHLNQYKSLYEIFGIAIAMGLSSWANCISNKSLRLTGKALRTHELEFKIHSRPFVILDNPRFSDKTTHDHAETVKADGSINKENVFNKSVTVTVKNISEIPARSVSCAIVVSLGELKGKMDIIPSISVKDADTRFTFGLPDDWYAAAKDGSKELSIDYSLTYSGILDEREIGYQTNVKILYYPKSGEFGYIKYDIR